MARKDIDQLNAQLIKGLETEDAAMMAGVYAPDAKLMAPNVEPMEGSAIRDFWVGAIESGLRGGSLETVSFEERDDLAVEEGKYTLKTEAGDIADEGKYVVVHRRQSDGSWRFFRDIFNSNRPAA